MKAGLSALLVAASLALAPAAWAITWDKAYEGDVLPNLSTNPVWNHANGGGTSSAPGDGTLYLTNGSPAANNSWDAPGDPVLSGQNMSFQYNDPDVAGENWVITSGQAFTIEWRMRINGPATLTPGGQTGIKLTYGGYPTNRLTRFDWYYDAVNHRLPNNRFTTWGSGHDGKTGPEGSETILTTDGFDNIQLGEWHTYKVTSVNMSGKWHRELWLDGNYVGRWWSDDNTSGSTTELKMRANNTTVPNTSVDFDYVRWAGVPDGQYVKPVVCPPVAPAFTSVAPKSIQPPASQRQLTISGTNLGELMTEGSTVSVTYKTANTPTTTTLPGTNLALQGDNLLGTFDFTGAPEGYYDVVGNQYGGCLNPVKLPLSIRYKPGTNLLVNSNFEGSKDPWTACDYATTNEFNGWGPYNGIGYLRKVNNWGQSSCVAEQTVSGITPGPNDLTLSFWALVWDNSNDVGYDSYAKGEIVVDGVSVAEVQNNSLVDTQSAWINKSVHWSGTVNSTVLVRLTLMADGRGGGGWGLAYVDEVDLATPPCNKPFADMDNDGDVDQDDFGQFQLCWSGTVSEVLPGCGCLDHDKSGKIDQADLNAFVLCVSGPTIPATVSCENTTP